MLGSCLDRSQHGTFVETGFAHLMAWRDWGFPDRSVVNCFAMGALRASDGAYLLGVMSAFTANAGRIYFPAGTPDPSDISGDTVDLLGRVLRELEEETGLGTQDLSTPPDWIAIVTGARLALIKPVAAKAGAGSAAGGAAPSRGRNWRTSGSCARPLISIPPCLIS
jgi:hypothetical protein